MTLTPDAAQALLAARMEQLRSETAIPGAVARILKDGAVLADCSWGEMRFGGPAPTVRTVMRIASMTKSFTAATVLLLRDRGLLRLDDRAGDYLPVPQVDGPPISIRDLLTMNAGLPTDDPWGDRQESLPYAHFDVLLAQGLRFTRPPRMGFEYSNAGYAILGRVISAVTGRDYVDVVADELLTPLRMHDSAFRYDVFAADRLATGYAEFARGLTPLEALPPGAFSAMGGLHSTIDDLTTWVNGFTRPDAHPLSWWSRQEMQQPTAFARVTAEDDFAVSASYGYGLLIDDHTRLGRFVHHSGGYPGFGSHMRWHAESGWAVILLANRTYANMRRVGEETMYDLVQADGGTPRIDLWPETSEAMDVCERLLVEWDDALADAWFSVNVDLDRPRDERRSMWQSAGAGVSDFARSAVTSQSPAHVRWTIVSEGVELDLELLMSPEPRPRIQVLTASRR